MEHEWCPDAATVEGNIMLGTLHVHKNPLWNVVSTKERVRGRYHVTCGPTRAPSRVGEGQAATHGLMAGRLRQVFHHNENRRGEMSLGMESGRPYPWGEVVIMGGEEVMLW